MVPVNDQATPNPCGTTAVEQVIDQFEEAWLRGQRPELAAFLPPDGSSRRKPLLVELAHIDLECRIKAGDKVPLVETYLEKYPELSDPDAAVSLIAAECERRWPGEPRVTREEYLRRFPRYAAQLRDRLRFPLECPHCRTETEVADETARETTCSSCGTAFPVPSSAVNPEVKPRQPPVPRTAGEKAWPHVPGYEILGELGRGGMGIVYKARQIGLNRLVALKMVLAGAHADEEELQRFRIEAEAAARLQHPGIVQIHEIGEHDGRPYFSLELVDGGSLDKKLAGTPWAPEQSAELLESLARAMHYAHDRGIVHRDLKPANILLQEETTKDTKNSKEDLGALRVLCGSFTPKITDFGLAKRLDDVSGRTQTGAIVGTPSYMAPEQAGGRPGMVGPAADEYALGAILYELLTGRPPFRAATVWDTVEQLMTQEPVPPRTLQPKVPRDLETICLKCLQKDPRKRYASAGHLAEDLRRFLAHEPIHARPVGAWERAVKWARRRPAWAILWAVSALAAATLVTVILLYTGRLQDTVAQERKWRREAAANLKTVRVTVQRYFTRISQTKMLNVPGLQPLRNELLEEALSFYQGLISQYGHDPNVRADLGATYHQLGAINFAMGRGSQAMHAYEEAMQIRRQLVAQRPDHMGSRNDLAETLNGYATAIKDVGRRKVEAEAHYREALAIRDSLVRAHPEAEVFQNGLADTLCDLAMLLKGLNGKAEEAIRLLKRARRVREQLVSREPDDPEGLYHLARVHNQLANLQTDNRKKPDALDSYRRALVIRRKLVARFPDNINYQNDLAWSHNNIGLLLSEIGRPKEAMASYRRAMVIRQQLAHDNPAVVEFQHNLASSYNNLGLLLYRLSGKDREALEVFEKGLDIRLRLSRKYPGNVLFKTRLAHILQNLGNLKSNLGLKTEAFGLYRQALELREEIVRADPHNAAALKHLTGTRIILGNLQRVLGKPDDALRTLERARRISAALVRDNPANDKFKDDLASSYNAIGLVHMAMSRPERALKALRTALGTANFLVRDNPRVTEYEAHLAQILANRGAVLGKLGRTEEALASLRRARQISRKITRDKPELTEQQAELSETCYTLGRLLRRTQRFAEAREALEEAQTIRERIARDNPNNLDERSNLAATLAEMARTLQGHNLPEESRAAFEHAIRYQQDCVRRAPSTELYRKALEIYQADLARMVIMQQP
jgi:tetratricopeptide (TPR) repeat protein